MSLNACQTAEFAGAHSSRDPSNVIAAFKYLQQTWPARFRFHTLSLTWGDTWQLTQVYTYIYVCARAHTRSVSFLPASYVVSNDLENAGERTTYPAATCLSQLPSAVLMRKTRPLSLTCMSTACGCA